MIIDNGLYKVAVQDVPESGGGLFTVSTSAQHPYWPNENIFYGGIEEEFFSTYSTVRSFTSHTDYVLSLEPYKTDLGYFIIVIGPASNTVRSGNSIQTTFTLTKPDYPDDLTIVQTISLHGTTFLDATIEITTSVTNTGSEPVSVGIRYLLDFMFDGDDATSFQQKSPDGNILSEERTFSPVPFQYYKMENVTGTPRMYMMGTALVPAPTPPDQVEFASWPEASDMAFTYDTTGLFCGDSCILYYWGNTDGRTLSPSDTTTVTALLFENQSPLLASRGISFLG